MTLSRGRGRPPSVPWFIGGPEVTGGRDIIIPTTRGTEALELAARAVKKFWPQAVLEDAVTGESLGSYPQISFAGREEILAFRDAAAAKLWDDIGADPTPRWHPPPFDPFRRYVDGRHRCLASAPDHSLRGRPAARIIAEPRT